MLQDTEKLQHCHCEDRTAKNDSEPPASERIVDNYGPDPTTTTEVTDHYTVPTIRPDHFPARRSKNQVPTSQLLLRNNQVRNERSRN